MLPAIDTFLSGRYAYVWGNATLHESNDLSTLVRLVACYLCDEMEFVTLSEHSIRDQVTGETVITFHSVPGDFWHPVVSVRFRDQSYFYSHSETNLGTCRLFKALSEV